MKLQLKTQKQMDTWAISKFAANISGNILQSKVNKYEDYYINTG